MSVRQTGGKSGTETVRILPENKFCNRSMLVCIQGWGRGEPYGQILHPECKETVPFMGLAELCLGIGRMASSLENSRERAECHITEKRPGQTLYGSARQEILFVEVFARQHRSLQGRYRGRLTGGRHIYFRSALELMASVKQWGRKRKNNTRSLVQPAFLKGIVPTGVKNR